MKYTLDKFNLSPNTQRMLLNLSRGFCLYSSSNLSMSYNKGRERERERVCVCVCERERERG